jgi:tetratricopeptide (TPR) repeat protein
VIRPPFRRSQRWRWYFINNNLGFSLNTLGQFAQGEIYCRKAIEVNASRPNAHKNLGIALAGQGEHREAARSFVAATQANAADARAFRLLQDLLRQHPELEYEFEAVAESCQKAVEVAAKKADEMKPVVLRGWRKHLFLLRMRLSSIRKRIQGGWR